MCLTPRTIHLRERRAESETGQAVDDIYPRYFPGVCVNVKIDESRRRTTPLNMECPDDIMPCGHREVRKTVRICTQGIAFLH